MKTDKRKQGGTEKEYQLTLWQSDPYAIKFAADQLEKYGGRKYVWRKNGRNEYAIFLKDVEIDERGNLELVPKSEREYWGDE